MKKLLLLAFVAFATAVDVPEPIRLGEPEVPYVAYGDSPISMMPLFISKEAMEAFQNDPEIIPPISFEGGPVEAAVDAVEASAINFVDAPLTNDAKIAQVSPVKFVDAPFEPVEAVRVVDAPVEQAVNEEELFVRFVEAAINSEAEIAEDINEVPVDAVRVVDAAALEEAALEVSGVRFVDAPLADEGTRVKVVDAPIEVEPIRVAPVAWPKKTADLDRPFKFDDPVLRLARF